MERIKHRIHVLPVPQATEISASIVLSKLDRIKNVETRLIASGNLLPQSVIELTEHMKLVEALHQLLTMIPINGSLQYRKMIGEISVSVDQMERQMRTLTGQYAQAMVSQNM